MVERKGKTLESGREKAREVVAQIQQMILGKQRQTEEIFLAFLADGHVFLEDIPGVGKTTLARAFARVLGLDYRRIQFTPDVMAAAWLSGRDYVAPEDVREQFGYVAGHRIRNSEICCQASC